MNKTLIIILLSILLIGAVAYIFTGESNGIQKQAENRLLREKDSIQALFKGFQVNYELKQKQLTILEANLLTHKAEVKRLEFKLSELLKRERYAQIEHKRPIERSNSNQLDSAFMAMYPVSEP